MANNKTHEWHFGVCDRIVMDIVRTHAILSVSSVGYLIMVFKFVITKYVYMIRIFS